MTTTLKVTILLLLLKKQRNDGTDADGDGLENNENDVDNFEAFQSQMSFRVPPQYHPTQIKYSRDL